MDPQAWLIFQLAFDKTFDVGFMSNKACQAEAIPWNTINYILITMEFDILSTKAVLQHQRYYLTVSRAYHTKHRWLVKFGSATMIKYKLDAIPGPTLEQT